MTITERHAEHRLHHPFARREVEPQGHCVTDRGFGAGSTVGADDLDPVEVDLPGRAARDAEFRRVDREMPATLTAFGISGDVKHGLAALLRTHPSLEDRIQALRNST